MQPRRAFRFVTILLPVLSLQNISPGQTGMLGRPSEPTYKETIIRMINTDKPGFPLDRLKGCKFSLEGSADSAGGKTWTSTPLVVHDCLGTARITDVPPGRYRLVLEPLKLEGIVVVPGRPFSTLQIRLTIGAGIEVRTFETPPNGKLNETKCSLITHRITLINPEEDLDALLRSVISSSLEEGRTFREGDLEKAIKAINALGLFLPLRRSDCTVRLADSSPEDLVDITIHLRQR